MWPCIVFTVDRFILLILYCWNHSVAELKREFIEMSFALSPCLRRLKLTPFVQWAIRQIEPTAKCNFASAALVFSLLDWPAKMREIVRQGWLMCPRTMWNPQCRC